MVDLVLNEPRFTHITLAVDDLVTAIEWYERYTPLRAVDQRREPRADTAWLCHPEPAEHPFVVVLSSFDAEGRSPNGRPGTVGHLGIELTSRAAVDAMAVLARADGCLASVPGRGPTTAGYVCALTDPDGNVVQFSYDRGVYESVRATLAEQAPSAAEEPSTAECEAVHPRDLD